MTDVETVAYATEEAVTDAVFDEATHVWTLRDGRARVVVATDGSLPAASACRPDGLSPYLGVAVHGVPNYFVITGPDVAAQKGYVAKCLAFMSRTSSTRIEVRSSAQRLYNDRSPRRSHRGGGYWRRVGRRIPSSFEVRALGLDDGPDDTVYEGPAIVTVGEHSHPTQARLTGRLDPIDGHYHWRGTLFDTGFEVRLPQDATVTVDDRAAAGRLTERTPWSTFSVAGLGAPPFALESIEVDVPLP